VTKKKLVLNDKRKRLLKELKKNPTNVAAAARKAGYAHPSSAHRSLSRVKLKLSELFDNEGGDATTVARKIVALLDATKIERTRFMGVTTETHHDPDNALRFAVGKFITGCHYPSTRSDEPEQTRTAPIFTINLGFLEPARAIEILERAKERAGLGDSRQLGVGQKMDEDAGRPRSDTPLQGDSEISVLRCDPQVVPDGAGSVHREEPLDDNELVRGS
jgi:hypothetical protein